MRSSEMSNKFDKVLVVPRAYRAFYFILSDVFYSLFMRLVIEIVALDMFSEVAFVSVSFTTYFALVGPIVIFIVRSRVEFESSFIGKFDFTNRALVPSPV